MFFGFRLFSSLCDWLATFSTNKRVHCNQTQYLNTLIGLSQRRLKSKARKKIGETWTRGWFSPPSTPLNTCYAIYIQIMERCAWWSYNVSRVCFVRWNLSIRNGQRDWQNLLAITRFRYIEVLFHIFCCYWSKENHSLYHRLRYVGVRYIEGFWGIFFSKPLFQSVAFEKC